MTSHERTGGPTPQAEQWRRGAVGWKKWAPFFAQRQDIPLYVERAQIAPGQRVLDVGAGTGDQALAVAERVGPEGSVLATDFSPEMIEVAQARVAAAGATNIELRVADAMSLGVPPESFDALVSGFTLMFVPEPEKAVQELFAALRPGARFALSVWGPPPTVPMLSLPMSVFGPELQLPPPDPSQPGLFSLADMDRLRDMIEAPGFTDVQVGSEPFEFTYESSAQYAEFLRDVAPALVDLVETNAPDRADELWGKVAAVAGERANPDGTITFANEFTLASGQRPG